MWMLLSAGLLRAQTVEDEVFDADPDELSGRIVLEEGGMMPEDSLGMREDELGYPDEFRMAGDSLAFLQDEADDFPQPDEEMLAGEAADTLLMQQSAAYYVPLDSVDALIMAFRPYDGKRFYVHRVVMDTTLNHFHDRSNVVLDRYKVGAWLGNLGLSYYSPLYHLREAPTDFMFTDNLRLYMHVPEEIDYFRTEKPYTLLQYSLAGGSGKEEVRMHITHTQNVNERTNLGLLFDSNAADGQYAHQATGDNAFTLFGSYRGEKYQLFSSLTLNKIKMKENGGLTNLNNFYTTNRSTDVYDTYSSSGQTVLNQTDFQVTQSYAFTFRHLVRVDTIFSQPPDSLIAMIPDTLSMEDSLKMVAGMVEMDFDSVYNKTVSRLTLVHSLKYTSGRRTFKDELADAPTLYPTPYISPRTNDHLNYSRLQNTIELMMQEKQRARMTAGFGVGLLNEIDHYDYGIIPDTVRTSSDTIVHTRRNFSHVNTAFTGRFFNHTGRKLNWDIGAKLYVTGYKLGAFEVDGDVRFHTYSAAGRNTLTLGATITNETPGYFLDKYSSNHFIWDNHFDDAQHIRLRASFENPQRGLKVGAYVSQLNKLIYFDRDALPAQTGKAIVAATGVVEKHVKAGHFHFLFDLYGQYSSEEDILPLPSFTGLQSSYFESWVVPDVLLMQLGYDVRYFTSYYAYAYMPATGVFHLQQEEKLGNYPFFNAFVDFKLKRMHISVTGESLHSLLNGRLEKKYFTVYRYPLNEARIKVGISWAFYD